MSSVGKLMFQIGIQEVDKKIADIRQAFDSFDAKYGHGINIKVQLDGAEDLVNKLAAIGDPKQLKTYQDEIDKLKKQLGELKDAADSVTTGRSGGEGTRLSNLDKLHTAMAKVNKSIADLEDVQGRAKAVNIDTSDVDAKIAKLREFLEVLKTVESTIDLSKRGALAKISFDGEQLLGNMNKNSYLSNTQNEVKALIKQLEELIKKQGEVKASASSGNLPKGSLAGFLGEESKQAVTEAEKLRQRYTDIMKSLSNALRELSGNRKQGRALGLQLPDITAAIQQLRSYHIALNEARAAGSPITDEALEKIQRMVTWIMKLSNEQRAANLAADNGTRRKNTTDTQQNTQAKQQNAEATRQMAQAEQGLSASLHQSSQSMSLQSSVLSNLRSLAAQYLGVWGGQQFLNNIIEIGGQLEMQRLSIGAILQNTAQANSLFDRIKGLAVKSPFGVVQLDQMTKQLTAYGFKYNELFDMTKRLADISAATGTDVGRLALALGHVKSEAALSGYTLRQFSMGNVPLLEKLAEKFGKTTGEIRKMVKAKEISYEDVKEVLVGLTDEGGMFYNMQEVISQSVKAKFKNVRDAMDIMYGEMAESGVGDALKGLADLLLQMTTHWRDMIAIVGSGVAVWGINRVATIAYTKSLGAANMATLASITAQRKQQAVQTSLAWWYRKLTDAEKQYTITSQANLRVAKLKNFLGLSLSNTQQQLILKSREQIVADLTLALTEKKVTTEFIAKQVALGKLTKAEGVAIIQNAKLSESEIRAGVAAVNNVRTYGRFTGVVNGLAFSIGKLGIALKSIFTSGQLWFSAALMAGMEIWTHYKGEMEKARDFAKSLHEDATESIKNTHSMLRNQGITAVNPNDNTETTYGIQEDYRNVKLVFPEFEKNENAQAFIDEWVQYIRDYSHTANEMINNAFYDEEGNVRSLKETYDSLSESVNAVSRAKIYLKEVSGSMELAGESTSGLWDDNALTNAKEWDKEIRTRMRHGAEIYKEYEKGVADAIKATEGFAPAFAEATKGLDGYDQKMMYLLEHMDDFSKDTYDKFINTLTESTGVAFTDLIFGEGGNRNDAIEDFTKQMELLAILRSDLKDGSEESRQALLAIFDGFVEKAEIQTNAVKNKLKGIVERIYGIKFDVDAEKKIPKQIDLIKKQLNSLVEGRDFSINIGTSTNIYEVIDTINKVYKEAKERIEKAPPMLLKMGITMSVGQIGELTDEQINQMAGGDLIKRQILLGVREAQRQVNDAMKASQAIGFKLEEPKSSGGGHKKQGHKNTTDKQLKEWRTEYDRIKNFYAEYKKLLKIYGGNEMGALAELQKNYGEFFKDGRPIYDPDNMKNALQNLLDRTSGTTEERKQFQETLHKAITDIAIDSLSDEVDNAEKSMKEIIDRWGNEFNLYKEIKDKIGEGPLANQAFVPGRVWDDVTEAYAAKLREITGDEVIDLDMDLTEAEKYFGKHHDAYELWKKIVELTRKNYTDALKKAASAQEQIMTNEERIMLKYEEIRKLTDDNSGIDHSAEIEKLRREISKLESELFELLPVYEKIFGDKTYKGYKSLVEAERLARELVDNATVGDVDPKTGKPSFYASYYMDGEEQQQVRLSRQQLEKLKKIIDSFFKDELKKDPFSTLFKSVKNLYKELSDGDHDVDEANEAWLKFAESLVDAIKVVSTLAGQLSDMFDALGNESMANAMDDLQAGLSSVSNIAQGFAKGGVVGGIVAVAGEAASWIGRLAKRHDQNLDKAIQKSAREVKRLENAYKNLQSTIERRLSGIYGGSEYNQMLANYKDQLARIEYQRKKEADKKKTDKDKILDYDQQIKEMRDTIKYFAEDMAKDLYSIDVKSWAKELTDAVVDAWAKGEDAAEAWHEKVRDIVKDITKNILAQKVVEAALQPTLDLITQEMMRKSGKLDEQSIEMIATSMEGLGDTADVLTALLDKLKERGIDLSEVADASSTSTIKGMTEETADLLLSYVNAIRADVSMNRELQTKMAANMDLLPTMSVTAQAQLQQLNSISQNTLRNADMAEQIYVLFNGLKTGAWRLEVQ